MKNSPVFLDSITDATEDVRGQIVISGSHGGMYPAAIASDFGPSAVIFHDAGIGLDAAGVAGVMALAGIGLAATAVDFQSCTIGSAPMMWDHGRISRANPIATALGVRAGMTVQDAVKALNNAHAPMAALPPVPEARHVIELDGGASVVLVDSASLVAPRDAGQIIVTGSHGGLIGSDPSRALKALARVAVFNDAGFGPQDIALSRLPALDAKGVAVVLLSRQSARIGEAASGLETGVISFTNATAKGMGASAGQPLKNWLQGLPNL